MSVLAQAEEPLAQLPADAPDDEVFVEEFVAEQARADPYVQLYCAAKEGKLAEAEALLAAGADPDTQIPVPNAFAPMLGNWTALHAACAGAHVEVAKRLLQQVLARRPKGRAGRPRHIAAEQNGALWAQLEASPTATAALHAQHWREAQGTVVDPHTMRDSIHRLGWRRVNGCWTPPRGTTNAEQLSQRRRHRQAA